MIPNLSRPSHGFVHSIPYARDESVNLTTPRGDLNVASTHLQPAPTAAGRANGSSYLTFTSQDFIRCVEDTVDRVVRFNASAGEFEVRTHSISGVNTGTSVVASCFIQVTLPPGTLPKLTFLQTPSCKNLPVFTLYNDELDPVFRSCEFYERRWPSELYGSSDRLVLLLKFYREVGVLRFTFTAVSEAPPPPHLELHFTSSVSGG